MANIGGILNVGLCIAFLATLITAGAYGYYQIRYSNILLTTCHLDKTTSQIFIPPPNLYEFQDKVEFNLTGDGNTTCGIDMCYLFIEYQIENKTVDCNLNFIFSTNTTILAWIPYPTVSQALFGSLITEVIIIIILLTIILVLCLCKKNG